METYYCQDDLWTIVARAEKGCCIFQGTGCSVWREEYKLQNGPYPEVRNHHIHDEKKDNDEWWVKSESAEWARNLWMLGGRLKRSLPLRAGRAQLERVKADLDFRWILDNIPDSSQSEGIDHREQWLCILFVAEKGELHNLIKFCREDLKKIEKLLENPLLTEVSQSIKSSIKMPEKTDIDAVRDFCNFAFQLWSSSCKDASSEKGEEDYYSDNGMTGVSSRNPFDVTTEATTDQSGLQSISSGTSPDPLAAPRSSPPSVVTTTSAWFRSLASRKKKGKGSSRKDNV